MAYVVAALVAVLTETGCVRNEGSLCDPEKELDFSILAIDISGAWRAESGDPSYPVRFESSGAPLAVAPDDRTWEGSWFGCERQSQFPLELGATNETAGWPWEGGGRTKTLVFAELRDDGYVLEWSEGDAEIPHWMELVIVDDARLLFDFSVLEPVTLQPYLRDEDFEGDPMATGPTRSSR